MTKGRADDCSLDIIVNMSATGGTLADTNGTAQTTVPTTAFQKSNSVDCWTLVGSINNSSTNRPEVTFTYASGTLILLRFQDETSRNTASALSPSPPLEERGGERRPFLSR